MIATMQAPTDQELATRAREEPDGDAFGLLYARHADDVFRLLVRVVGDAALAEDALQEAFLRAHQFLDRWDPARPFRPWLLQVARNTGLNALRARRKAGPVLTDVDRATSDRIARAAGLDEAAEAARAALAALDDEVRTLLVERHGLGLSLDELAASYGCTERTIRNRLHAAVDALTRALLESRQAPAQREPRAKGERA